MLSSDHLLIPTKKPSRTLRILSVASSLPYPPNDGTRNRTWNLLSRVAESHEVTLLTWRRDSQDLTEHVDLVSTTVDRLLHCETDPPVQSRFDKLNLRLRGMRRGLPPYVMEKLVRSDRSVSLEGKFDVAIAEDDAALFLMPEVDCPIVVQRHNIYQETIRGLIDSGNLGWARRAKWLSELGVWRRYDHALATRPDLSIVTTEEAKSALLRSTPDVHVEVVPNGVVLPIAPVEIGDKPLAVFVGQMNYEPNADAVLHFVKRIWPEIRKRLPEAEFRVIGRAPLRALRRLDVPGVTIVGEVEDVAEACQGAMLGVVPLNAGSGIKTKTLDLMAMGLPVVATPVGAEGVRDAGGHGLFICRTDEEFSGVASELMSEPAFASAMGTRAREFSSRYSWDESATRYLDLLNEVAESRDRQITPSVGFGSFVPRLRVRSSNETKTRVLYINGTGERAGAERMLVHLLTNLDRDSYEPVVAFLGKGPFVDEVAALGVKVIQLDDPGRLREVRKWKRVVRSIRNVISETGAQLVHANGEKMSIYAGRASAAEGIQCISWLHDAPGAGGLSGRLAQFMLRRTPLAAIVTCARWMEQDFNAKMSLGATAIPNCLDLTSLPGRNRSMQEIKIKVGWNEDDVVVAHFARLQRWKGTEVFLESAAQLAAKYDGVKFLVVGDALFGRELDYRAELREMAKRLGLDGKLIFTGFRSDALEIMAESDVVVHSSIKPDPFPLVVLEGMALGRPVVASCTRGPEEAIDHGVTGLLTPPGDVGKLTEAISQLIESSSLRHRLGYQAWGVARKRFSAPVMTFRFESLYQEILGEALQPSESIARSPASVLVPAKA